MLCVSSASYLSENSNALQAQRHGPRPAARQGEVQLEKSPSPAWLETTRHGGCARWNFCGGFWKNRVADMQGHPQAQRLGSARGGHKSREPREYEHPLSPWIAALFPERFATDRPVILVVPRQLTFRAARQSTEWQWDRPLVATAPPPVRRMEPDGFRNFFSFSFFGQSESQNTDSRLVLLRMVCRCGTENPTASGKGLGQVTTPGVVVSNRFSVGTMGEWIRQLKIADRLARLPIDTTGQSWPLKSRTHGVDVKLKLVCGNKKMENRWRKARGHLLVIKTLSAAGSGEDQSNVPIWSYGVGLLFAPAAHFASSALGHVWFVMVSLYWKGSRHPSAVFHNLRVAAGSPLMCKALSRRPLRQALHWTVFRALSLGTEQCSTVRDNASATQLSWLSG